MSEAGEGTRGVLGGADSISNHTVMCVIERECTGFPGCTEGGLLTQNTGTQPWEAPKRFPEKSQPGGGKRTFQAEVSQRTRYVEKPRAVVSMLLECKMQDRAMSGDKAGEGGEAVP